MEQGQLDNQPLITYIYIESVADAQFKQFYRDVCNIPAVVIFEISTTCRALR